ncbi:hypothetical protein M514_00642 [Trichuris suis]|uniref:Uncharacterized protein n=1 Tax=Trichuris suis TaxID=68888 RepID=A0A085N727_9BILA|nr:hypothetical protein M513_00642 [Trichuris suis]KFD65273.1 hypothetical protein M514_00642 [Trichuris suis]
MKYGWQRKRAHACLRHICKRRLTLVVCVRPDRRRSSLKGSQILKQRATCGLADRVELSTNGRTGVERATTKWQLANESSEM